jgi:sporulation protein YlmC with PRC-barrel domain
MLAGGVALASLAGAQQTAPAPQGKAPDTAKQGEQQNSKLISTTFRADKLKGMKVRNREGEDLGSIEDMVIDMASHQVRYAALSYGGFLGVGDKLFAVPIEALKIRHDGDKAYFVVDIDKETLKNAPGFSKNAWPDFADKDFVATMEKHFGRYDTVEGTVESTAGGKLQVQDRNGKSHEFTLAPMSKIVADGKSAKLNDLNKGQFVKVTISERDGKQVATTVETQPFERTARQPGGTTNERR